MAEKTPKKVMSRIQIQRTNNVVLERDINLSTVVENAIKTHVAALLGVTEQQALDLIAQWRILDIWIDEPHDV